MLKHQIYILKHTPINSVINEDEALNCESSSSEGESIESSLVSDSEEQVFDVYEKMELPAAVKELYKRFCISDKVGFLIENPVRKLPEQFAKWEELAKNVVDLLEKNCFRKTIEEELKIIDDSVLQSREEMFHAAAILTHIGAAYVNDQNFGGPAQVLPAQIAVPWFNICSRLKIHPTLTNYIAANCNWDLHDSSKPAELDNLKAITSLTRNRAYEWFMMIPVRMEIQNAPVLNSLMSIRHILQLSIKEWDEDTIVNNFKRAEISLREMTTTLMRMRDHIDPMEFYHGMRPYLAGSYNNPGLPNGLIFEGVSEEGKRFIGGSAAQTAITPSMDAMIPVKHHQAVVDYNLKLRHYIPKEHREFLEYLDNGPTLTDMIAESENEVICEAFNNFIDAYVHMRSSHITIVTSFIVLPASSKKEDFLKTQSKRKDQSEQFVDDDPDSSAAQKGEKEEVPEEVRRMQRRKYSRSHSLSDVGTGGTPFMVYLKSIRDATDAAKL